jgi:UDP-N-acetylmuramate dehydrogenase
VPVTPIGVGSNLLVRDGGVEGVVVRLGRPFGGVEAQGPDTIRAGSAVLDAQLPSAPPRRGSAGSNSTAACPARSAAPAS